MYCSKCGKLVSDQIAFCPYCGNALKNNPDTIAQDNSIRRTEYKGNVVKCPNCGETVGAFDSVCPLCGYEFQNASGVSSVRELNRQLLLIDQQSYSAGSNASYAGFRKAELIRTFGIPNTKGDVLEFMILASSNIDLTVLSVSSGDDIGMSDQEFDSRRALSDAWLAKIEQVYQKAKISFSEDSSYDHIQQIYERTYNNVASARELAKKAENKSRKKESQNLRAQRAQDIKIAKLKRVKKETTAGSFFKWFFIVIGIIVGLFIIGLTISLVIYMNEEDEASHKQLEWPATGLAQMLPDSKFPYGEVDRLSDDELSIDVFDISLVQFDSYVNECKKAGFTYNVESRSGSYEAYTEDGYYLDLYYYNSSKTMQIQLTVPVKTSQINWDDVYLTNQFPLPSSNIGNIELNKDNHLIINITGISTTNYKDYVNECKNYGYTIGTAEQETSFTGYNEDGYRIAVLFDDSVRQTMTIRLEAPEELAEIKWPTTGLGANLPAPPTNMGKISVNSDSWFSVTVSMTKDQYDEYVEACKTAGFTKEVSSFSDWYEANNSSKMRLAIFYNPNNQVSISLTK